MPLFDVLIFIPWMILWSYWLISAMRAKRSIRSDNWWRGAGVRLGFIILIFVLTRIPAINQFVRSIHAETPNPVLASIGVLICALGTTLAISARVSLGSDWGMPMTFRERPELVTTGPYSFVRHPIYAGFILAMLGTALVVGEYWLIPTAVVSVYFVYSAKTEEKYMLQQFPEDYQAYKRRTKSLIPFMY